jgi:hypothetical protein
MRVLVSLAAVPMAMAAGSSARAGAAPGPVRHLIYVHGRIVQEQQSARPESPRYGHYELDLIRRTLRDRGFEVTSEIRPKSTTESQGADHVAAQVRRLLQAGVPASRVTVVGASMGAVITLRASARLQNPDLRFAALGPCLARSVAALRAEEGQAPSGRLLVVREASDETVPGPCPAWSGDASLPALSAREIVLHTGLSHGFLYRPLPEWVDPVVAWASAP